MMYRLEAAALFPAALLYALLARLLPPAATPPRVMPQGPSQGMRRPAVAPPPGEWASPWGGTLPAPAGSLTCEGGGVPAAPVGHPPHVEDQVPAALVASSPRGGGDQPGGPAPVASCPPPVFQACSVASRAPAVAPPPLATLRVVELRALARSRGLRGMGSARRAVLLEALA